MTEIKFSKVNGELVGFEISGHSTRSAEDIEGKIVCSAVSSAAYLTANTLSEFVKAEIAADVNDGYMKITVKSKISESQITLNGFYLHVNELSNQYRNHVKVYSEV